MPELTMKMNNAPAPEKRVCPKCGCVAEMPLMRLPSPEIFSGLDARGLSQNSVKLNVAEPGQPAEYVDLPKGLDTTKDEITKLVLDAAEKRKGKRKE